MREHDIRTVLSEGGTDVATTALRDMAIAGLILNGLAGYDPEDGEQAASDQFFLATEIRKEREKATRGLTEGGTDIDEAIRRAAVAVMTHKNPNVKVCCCSQCEDRITDKIHQHIGPVIAAKDAEIAAHIKAISYQCHLRELSNRDRDEWKRRAEAAEAALELAEGYAANSIAELQAHLAAAREDTARLDWLELQQVDENVRRVILWPAYSQGHSIHLLMRGETKSSLGATLREAIDAAREKGGA